MAQPIHPIQSSILWGGDIFHPPTKTKNGLVETYGVCSVLVLPTFNPAWRSFSQWLWSHFLWNSALVYIMPSKAGIMFRKVALCNLPLRSKWQTWSMPYQTQGYPNALDKSGRTPIQYAMSENGHTAEIVWFLESLESSVFYNWLFWNKNWIFGKTVFIQNKLLRFINRMTSLSK